MLYEFARELSSLLETEDVVEAATRFIEAHVPRQGRDPRRSTPRTGSSCTRGRRSTAAMDAGAAQWALDKASPRASAPTRSPAAIPLSAVARADAHARRARARARSRALLLVPEQRRQLETFAFLTAISLERVHYVEVAQQALLHMESERLRNSLLAALSHDLRTPLAAGGARGSAAGRPSRRFPQSSSKVARAIAEKRGAWPRWSATCSTWRGSRPATPSCAAAGSRSRKSSAALVAAQRRPGARAGRGERGARRAAGRDRRDADRAGALQPAREAGKYTPPGTPVAHHRCRRRRRARLRVSDPGPGSRKARRTRSSRSSRAASRESTTPGVGLGLAIAARSSRRTAARSRRTIARRRRAFTFTLPLGMPPALP